MYQTGKRWHEKMSLNNWKCDSFYERSEATINMDSYLITPSAWKKSSIKKEIVPQTWKSVFERRARKLFKWMGIQNTQNDFTDSALPKTSKKINVIENKCHLSQHDVVRSLTSKWNGLGYWAPTSRVIHQHLIYIVFAGKGSNVLLTGYFFWSARVLSEVRERRSVWESGATVPLTVMHCCAQGVTYP